MPVDNLQRRFEEINNAFSSSVQLYIASSQCDADTKLALDEIARQTFYAIVETQSAIIDCLRESK